MSGAIVILSIVCLALWWGLVRSGSRIENLEKCLSYRHCEIRGLRHDVNCVIARVEGEPSPGLCDCADSTEISISEFVPLSERRPPNVLEQTKAFAKREQR